MIEYVDVIKNGLFHTLTKMCHIVTSQVHFVFNIAKLCLPFCIFRSLRWAAYRQFTWWIHGYLGRRVRRVIPACAVSKIRKTFPAPDGQYEPYASDVDE